MIRGARTRLERAGALALLLGLLLSGTPGCASLGGGLSTGPSGLSTSDEELRNLLASGRPDTALAMLDGEEAPAWVGDDLLRLQHQGLVAHYAGRWEESSRALEQAYSLAEDRYTKSVSRAVLSMLASDRVLAYDPPRPERLFLHYYNALNYLRRGEADEAAVEARRLGQVLQQALDDEDSSVPGDLGRALSIFAGTIFEAAGQANDAAVSYRRARAFGHLAGGHGGGVPTGEAPDPWRELAVPIHAARAPGDSSSPAGDGAGAGPVLSGDGTGTGRVLVILERGYVAHKVERDLTLVLLPREVHRLQRIRRSAAADTAKADTTELMSLAEQISERSFSGGSRTAAIAAGGIGGDDPVIARIAWPEFRESTERVRPASLRVDGDSTIEVPGLRADLSRAVRQAFAGSRTALMAKSLIRAAAKLSIAEGIREAVSEQDETLGDILGTAAQVAGALLERADTRSWHLLPDELQLYLLRLPAGAHDLTAVTAAAGGGSLRLDTVHVSPGGIQVVTGRAWR